MTDEVKTLVERLRATRYTEVWPGFHKDKPINPDGPEAADLIETQAREIDHWGALVGDNARAACKVLDEKDAEIERLREALEAIADGEGDAQDIARQTLEGDTHDQ